MRTLVTNADALGKGDQVRRALGPALGTGLLTADGAHWKWQRQSVASAFRPSSLKELQPAMLCAARNARDRLLEHLHQPVDIGHEMMKTTFDIIVETMMSGGHGIDVGRVERSITDYLSPSGWKLCLKCCRRSSMDALSRPTARYEGCRVSAFEPDDSSGETQARQFRIRGSCLNADLRS